uniref:Uncharacterized protein n=1 Tax=Anguilla anguilla TaxID=7936 RepID=A0A0E9WBW2_ANGAN
MAGGFVLLLVHSSVLALVRVSAGVQMRSHRCSWVKRREDTQAF